MARGKTNGYEEAGDDASGAKHTGVHAMEMTKWFDTNYHYIVPEFYEGQKFSFASAKAVDEFHEALSFGIKTKPVLLGPFTFLKLGKIHGKDFDRYRLLPDLTEVYVEVLQRLASAQAEWVQLDEPALALDLTQPSAACFSRSTLNWQPLHRRSSFWLQPTSMLSAITFPPLPSSLCTLCM